jgi:transposase, IS30 family
MYKHLSNEQRVIIAYMLKLNKSKKEIAHEVGCSIRTIYYEVKRNSSGGRNQCYNAGPAQKRSEERRMNSVKKPALSQADIELLRQKIGEEKWSPEQVCGRIRSEGKPMACHETIYRYIYMKDKPNGGLLHLSLRQSHRKRRRRKNIKQKRGMIKDRVSISMRPKIVELKNRIGDYEADTIVGKGHKSNIATITDRKSLYTFMIKLDSKESKHTARRISQKLKRAKATVRTITVDNGKEFAAHKIISKNLNAQVYFAHPYSAFERGANENINGLIRQYLPKKTDFNNINHHEIKKIENELNNRPRKKLNYKTPKEVFLCETSN